MAHSIDTGGAAQLPPLFTYDSIDSTQAEATRLIASQPAPFWVRAEAQSAGRGRAGRSWLGVAGNYFASLVWPMPADRADAPKLSLVTALALYRSLDQWGVPDLAVKWPNDVLVGERKIAGILLEAQGDHVIIGVGVNIVTAPERDALAVRAFDPVALSDYVDHDAAVFHDHFSTNLARQLQDFEQFGFDPIRTALNDAIWVRADLVYDNGAAQELVAVREIAKDGALIVNGDAGEKRIYAGELWP